VVPGHNQEECLVIGGKTKLVIGWRKNGELWYNSPKQYVEARGWTLSHRQKLQFWQIQENIFQQATGASGELHNGFKGMVNRLYNMIERDGLKDQFTGKPAINFLDKDSFIQTLHHGMEITV
jgi:hypothetical protein